jgi:fructokinase
LTIVCVGEAIADLICERELDAPEEADSFAPHPGGALANVAVAVARAGGRAALLGGVGDDPWGRWLRRGLEAEGVHCGWLATAHSVPTPLAIATFDRNREPSFQVYGAGIAETMRAGAEHLDEAMAEASALVFGSNTLVGETERRVTLEARRRALELGVPVLFDPNLRPNRWRDMDVAIGFCRELCEGAFLVRATRAEAAQLTGIGEPAQAAAALCELGARLAVVTMGAEGALIRGEASAEAPAPEVEVVAPLGAGDAFMGELAAGLARLGWAAGRAAEALPAATAAGARACQGWGAQ